MPNVNETLDLVKAAQAKGEPFTKAFTQSGSPTSGLTAYDLEAPAKTLYPVITPLRNRIPRVGGGVGTAANWRAITGINTTRMPGGVSEGNRGGVITTSTKDYTQAYKAIGFEDNVTFEADYSAQGFDDVKARAVQGLLRSVMIYEELLFAGGSSSIALGQPSAPTVANAGTGGTIAAGTYNVYVFALTMEGFLASSVSSTGIPRNVARSNADGTTDNIGGGSSQASAAGSTTTTGSTSVITATVPLVKGAVAYAWFVGTAGNEKIAAVTTINSMSITALPSAGNQTYASMTGLSAPANDLSQNALVYDGLIPFCFGLTAGALTTVTSVGSTATISTGTGGSLVCQHATGTAGTGTALTADGKGGIVEIDAMLKAYWDVYKLSPDTLYVNAQEAQNITQKVLTGNSNPAFRFNLQADQSGLVGGMVVAAYLNKFAMGGAVPLKIQLHPNLPPGSMLYYSESIPYPLSNVPSPLQFKARKEYYQLEWPLKTRKYEYGVYADGMLQNYFPAAFAFHTNIGNG